MIIIIKIKIKIKIVMINNCCMKLRVIVIILIKAKVCVICRSQRLKQITQTEALIIIATIRKPNPIIARSYYAYS